MREDSDPTVSPQYIPTLTPRAGADLIHVELGLQYWGLIGVADESSRPVVNHGSHWAHAATDLSTKFAISTGRLYLYAAAGVEATLDQYNCPRCDRPILLISRSTLDGIIRGADPTHPCGRCDTNFQANRRQVADPAREAARRLRAQQDDARRRAAQEIRQQKRDRDVSRRREMRVAFPMHLCGETEPAWNVLRTHLDTELGVLALLGHAPTVTPIPPPSMWPGRFAPDSEIAQSLLEKAWVSGLLRIHPDDSPLSTLVWDEKTDDQPTDRFRPLRASWYAWQGPSMETAALRLQEHLRDRVALWLWTEQGVADAVELATELIAAETLSYMHSQLALHHLPPVSENHWQRLFESAMALAATRSIGECYSIAWRAVRSAAAASKQHPYAPAENMTTHAVNWFETTSVRAATNRSVELPIYRESATHPISDLTRTLLLQVLELDLMESSPITVASVLSGRPGYPHPLDTVYDVEQDLDGRPQPDEPAPPPIDDVTAYRNGLLAACLARAQGKELTLERVEAFLRGGPTKLIDAADIAPHSESTIRDAFNALVAYHDTMTTQLPPDLVGQADLAFAYLLSGTFARSTPGESGLVGQLFGDEVAACLGINE